MKTIYKIEAPTHSAAVRSFLNAFMEAEKERSLLVPLRSPHNDTVMPTLVTDINLLAQADPLSPAFPLNSAKLVSRLTRRSAGEPMAAFLRPCELRAFVELAKINQGSWDNLVIISATCAGAVSNDVFRQKGRTEKEAYTDSFLNKRLTTGFTDTLEGDLATACTICTRPFPENADITIDLPDPTVFTGITIQAGTEQGMNILKEMPLTPSDKPGKSAADRKKQISTQKNRQQEVFAQVAADTAGLTELGDYLSSCINCYNCRVACPVCFCKECVFNTEAVEYEPFQYQGWARARGGLKMPADTLFFHITRMVHMGLSCVGCGQCSNACPNDIPLAELFKMVGEKAQKGFNYLPGTDVETPPPLSIFNENEFTDVTGVT